MTNPVLVDVKRGDRTESRHRGSICVVDGDGGRILALGDVDTPVFPRSAVKVMQALPLVESGAADALGFGDRELALACASHQGEAAHASLAAAMLERAGADVAALECGTHWPMSHDATVELARAGRSPSPLHNNCSGKHAGFVCTCRHLGIETRGYVNRDHAYQRMIAEAMTEVTGAEHCEANAAIDGCAIPTYRVPLTALALGFARLATGTSIGPARTAAASRLMRACMAEPFCVAGTGKFDTEAMRAGGGRVFLKTGAEGVYCGAIPELGLGLALKVDDGAGRAAEVAVAALLAHLLAADDLLGEAYARMAVQDIPNRNGALVGAVRADLPPLN